MLRRGGVGGGGRWVGELVGFMGGLIGEGLHCCVERIHGGYIVCASFETVSSGG